MIGTEQIAKTPQQTTGRRGDKGDGTRLRSNHHFQTFSALLDVGGIGTDPHVQANLVAGRRNGSLAA